MKSVTSPDYTAQRRLRMGGTEVFFHLSDIKNSCRQSSHSHTVQVDKPALPLVALRGQEVLKVLDLVGQLRV